MSKKRTSDEANNDDEQTNEDSDLFQEQEVNKSTKRAKLNTSSDTTLQDLPNEQLQCILVKAVVMEVVDMRLARRVWEEKASLVINRLKDVCLNWRRILSTNEFETEVQIILDDTDEETVRVEHLLHAKINFFVRKVTTLKEEIFMLCGEDDQGIVNVYDRNNIAEAKVKDVIALPGTRPVDIEACNMSNCLYVLCLNMESQCPSVLRVTKDEEHYNSLPWISGLRMPVYSISVSKSGVLAVPNGCDPVGVSLYNTTGSMVLAADIYGFKYVDKVIQKSDGNLILASINGRHLDRVLTEISTDGKIQRQYRSVLREGSGVNSPDKYGRILISKPRIGLDFVDSELNQLDFALWPDGRLMLRHHLHYNSDTDEMMVICVFGSDRSAIHICRFA